jgi:hypothetical protein
MYDFVGSSTRDEILVDEMVDLEMGVIAVSLPWRGPAPLGNLSGLPTTRERYIVGAHRCT